MGNPSFEYPRPELNQTIIFDETPVPDSEAIEAKNGRLIPGYNFSQTEFQKLWELAKTHDESDDSHRELHIPTVQQILNIEITRPYGCWELPVYDDKKNRARYGRLAMGELTNSTLAHRVMYMVFYGADNVSPDQHIDHLCENKACCYPRHLEPVSHATNTIRGFIAKRHSDGQLGFDFD